MSLNNARHVVLGSIETSLPALASRSIRFDFKYDHFDPTTLTDYGGLGATWTHVRDDVYDFYYNDTDWGTRYWAATIHAIGNLFRAYSSSSSDTPFRTHSFDILDANLDGVTDAEQLFGGSAFTGLQSIASIRNTSSVTNFKGFLSMGRQAAAYTSIPLFDTSSAVDVRDMFQNAINVTTGALALYTQMSTQANPPTSYSGCFSNCGSNTVTGAAELAQIPASWGGTMPEQVTCPECGGTGEVQLYQSCSECGGTGQVEGVTCHTCEGTGSDPETGDTCPECGGTGIISETCNTCGGTGTIAETTPCGNCNGSGAVDDGEGGSTPCPVCEGMGVLPVMDTCQTCGGTGHVNP